MATGVGVAVALDVGVGVLGSVEKKFTASAADRNTALEVSKYLALIIWPINDRTSHFRYE